MVIIIIIIFIIKMKDCNRNPFDFLYVEKLSPESFLNSGFLSLTRAFYILNADKL